MLYEKADLWHLKGDEPVENHGLSVLRVKFMLYLEHLNGFSEGKGDSLTNKIQKLLKLLQNHVHVSKSAH